MHDNQFISENMWICISGFENPTVDKNGSISILTSVTKQEHSKTEMY
jgi:hypothetical protein